MFLFSFFSSIANVSNVVEQIQMVQMEYHWCPRQNCHWLQPRISIHWQLLLNRIQMIQKIKQLLKMLKKKEEHGAGELSNMPFQFNWRWSSCSVQHASLNHIVVMEQIILHGVYHHICVMFVDHHRSEQLIRKTSFYRFIMDYCRQRHMDFCFFFIQWNRKKIPQWKSILSM